MICKTCDGEGWIKHSTEEGGLLIAPCFDCIGGVASVRTARCAGCGAPQEWGLIRCTECGQPLVFEEEA